MYHGVVHLKDHYDLPYDPILEFFVPKVDQMTERPGILICPGGGYSWCSHREGDPIALHFLARNYRAFVLYYTVKPEVGDKTLYPLPQLDALAALDYIKKHAEEFHLIPEKIAIIGFSAGGHLAASIGLNSNNKKLQKQLGLENADLTPAAVALGYPVIDLGEETHQGTSDALVSGDPTLIETLSVNRVADETYPPTFIWTTDDDGCVPSSNSKRLAERLTEVGVKNKLIVYPHGNHGLATAFEDTCPIGWRTYTDIQGWFGECDSFLREVFQLD